MNDNIKMFKDYVKVCDIIAKICGDIKIVVSNGVFMWKADGLFSICTFTEKMEKEICPLLYNVYGVYPALIVVLDKYMSLSNIIFNDGYITLQFGNTISDDMLEDKVFGSHIDDIYKDNGIISIDLKYDNDYEEYYNIIDKVNNDAIHQDSVYMSLDADTVSKSESVIDMVVGGDYRVRIAKSLFGSINKGDSIGITCVPYGNSSNIFLVKATNSKERCLLTNFTNAMKL